MAEPGAGCLQPGAAGECNEEETSCLLRCELLCFVQKRSVVLTTDDMVNICSNFYSWKEVESSRLLLSGYVPEKRLPRHKSTAEKDKIRKTMLDIIKICLDPSADLPTFYALDLARLPRLGVDHVDMSAILQELTLLRQEVRDAARLAEEVAMSRQEIAQMQQLKSTVDDVCQEVDKLRVDQMNFPPLPSHYASAQLPMAANGQLIADAADL